MGHHPVIIVLYCRRCKIYSGLCAEAKTAFRNRHAHEGEAQAIPAKIFQRKFHKSNKNAPDKVGKCSACKRMRMLKSDGRCFYCFQYNLKSG